MNETYDRATSDFVAKIILDALFTQDATTFNGSAGDMGQLALETSKKVQDQIRHGGFTS